MLVSKEIHRRWKKGRFIGTHSSTAFFVFSLLVLLTPYLSHSVRLMDVRRDLKSSTLIYSDSASLNWMPQRFADLIGAGIDCSINRTAECSDGELPRLELAHGSRLGRSAIAALADDYVLLTEGTKAALSMIVGSVTAFIFHDRLSRWLPWVALLLAAVSWCFPVQCVTCTFGAGWLAYLPLMVVALGTATLLMALLPSPALTGFLISATAIGVVITQAVLLLIFLKFCPVCIGVSVVSIVVALIVIATEAATGGVEAQPRRIACGQAWSALGCASDGYCFFPLPNFLQDYVGTWTCDSNNNIGNFTCISVSTDNCCLIPYSGFCHAQCPCPTAQPASGQ